MSFETVNIGPCTLIRGDCLEVLPTLRGVDAVVTDPPYGIGLRNGDVDGHRSDRSFRILGDESQEVGCRMLQWCDLQELPTIAFASPFKPWPGQWRNLIAWDKGGAVGGGGDIATCLKRTWELIQVARNEPLDGGRLESVWRYPMVPADTQIHICAKPLRLMSKLLDVFCSSASVVLDPFMGSGTTGAACIECEKGFIGVELDPVHFETACKRVSAMWDWKCRELPFDEPRPVMKQRDLLEAAT